MYLILALALAVLILFLYLKLSKRIIISSFHISNLLTALCVAAFVVLIIIYPKVSLSAAINGVGLWFNIIFPSLLPFVIACELLIGLGFVNFIGTLLEPFMRFLFNVPGAGSFALAMGFTSGYPTGAKVTTMLRERNLCTKTEGERLLTFTNNSGPLFILGAVAVGMFNNPKLGVILALAHYSAAITVGILFRFYKRKEDVKKEPGYNFGFGIFKKAFREMFKARREDGRNFGLLLGDSVKNSVNLLLMVGGFIIFFSVLISLLNETKILLSISSVLGFLLSPLGVDGSLINSILSGFFEVTNGCKLASLTSAEYIKKIVAEAFILGWAGLSIHFQIISIVTKTDISPVPFMFGKFLQAFIAAVYTYLLYIWLIPYHTVSVFKTLTQQSWLDNLMFSGEIFVVLMLIFIMLSLVIAIFAKKRSPLS